jgi:hypothetical protein
MQPKGVANASPTQHIEPKERSAPAATVARLTTASILPQTLTATTLQDPQSTIGASSAPVHVQARAPEPAVAPGSSFTVSIPKTDSLPAPAAQTQLPEQPEQTAQDLYAVTKRIAPPSESAASTVRQASQFSLPHTMDEPDAKEQLLTAIENIAGTQPPEVFAGAYILSSNYMRGGQAVVVFARDCGEGFLQYAIKYVPFAQASAWTAPLLSPGASWKSPANYTQHAAAWKFNVSCAHALRVAACSKSCAMAAAGSSMIATSSRMRCSCTVIPS